MATQFIINSRGEKTAAIVPINDYEDLLHKHHLKFELTDEYKRMIDEMLEEEKSGKAQYVPYREIEDKFRRK